MINSIGDDSSYSMLLQPRLREIKLIGQKISWANSLQTPTNETLDRVLVSTE